MQRVNAYKEKSVLFESHVVDSYVSAHALRTCNWGGRLDAHRLVETMTQIREVHHNVVGQIFHNILAGTLDDRQNLIH